MAASRTPIGKPRFSRHSLSGIQRHPRAMVRGTRDRQIPPHDDHCREHVFQPKRGFPMDASGSSTEVFGHFPWAQPPAAAQLVLGAGGLKNPTIDRAFSGRRTGALLTVPTAVSFGPFRLLPAQFLLLEGDKPVPLGSRALEILVVLLERPGEVVSKQELMARVWPNIFVEPANLTVHISALRRTLRDGQDGNRFIINIPGRGYSFVASVAVVGRLEPDGIGNRGAPREQS